MFKKPYHLIRSSAKYTNIHISLSIGGVKKVFLERPGVLNRSYPQLYTAKNQNRKFETNIPRKGIARPLSQFPYSVSEFYITTIGLPILLQEICGPILGIYINRSQTHECGNWD
jgi:hypothetical protein